MGGRGYHYFTIVLCWKATTQNAFEKTKHSWGYWNNNHRINNNNNTNIKKGKGNKDYINKYYKGKGMKQIPKQVTNIKKETKKDGEQDKNKPKVHVHGKKTGEKVYVDKGEANNKKKETGKSK